MCILPRPDAPVPPLHAPARLLAAEARQQLAVQALAGQPVRALAQTHLVSRKFVARQREQARQALEQAFAPPRPDDDLLFTLPVTRPWLRQLVLGLVLIGHCPLRGVTELLGDLFDYSLSVGTVFNILHQAVAVARRINAGQDLSAVRVGAHDEIFQAGQPVLVGACAETTYCYLLSLEEHRDADTWGVRLLELAERGFAPQATIADAAAGLRAGHEQALPAVPCRGDVFHALREVRPLVRYLENRAYDALTARTKLQRQQAAAEKRRGRKQADLAQRLRYARLAEAQAVALADDVAALWRWLREDILAVAGPDRAGGSCMTSWSRSCVPGSPGAPIGSVRCAACWKTSVTTS
jgi:hypothetical protein